MRDKAYINGIQVSLNFVQLYRDVRLKLIFNKKLSAKERSFYLLFMATDKEAKEYLKNEKETK
jgi:hypothetical protein